MKKIDMNSFLKKVLGLVWMLCVCFYAIACFNIYKVSAAEEVYESESNDIITNANKASVGTVINGSLEKSGDVDWFAFTIPEDGYICLTLEHEYIDDSYVYWKTFIYSEDNSEIAYDNWNGNVTVTQKGKEIGLAKGTYYLKVTTGPYRYSNTPYQIVINYNESNYWEKGLNEIIVEADSIPLNKEIGGTLNSEGDKDWYVFSVPEDGYIWVSFLHEYINDSYGYWMTRLYTKGNAELDSQQWNGDALKTGESNKIGLPAGEYYILIEKGPYRYSDSSYHFKINYKTAASWEKEQNNIIIDANKIPINTYIHGSVMNDSDIDWYSFELDKPGNIRVMLRHDYLDDSYAYWSLTIRNNDNKELGSKSISGNSIGDTFSDTLSLSSGSYYLEIKKGAYRHSDIEYIFSIDYTTSSEFSDNRDDLDKNNDIQQYDDGTKISGAEDEHIETLDTGELIYGSIKYKILEDDEVSVVGASSKDSNIIIPSEFRVNGIDYEVVNIGKNAFKNNKNLQKVTIEADLDYIGANAFAGCKKLKTVNVVGDVDIIYGKAFYKCKKLSEITIQTDRIEKIGKKAFSRINKKAVVTIPASAEKNYDILLEKGGIPSKVTIVIE